MRIAIDLNDVVRDFSNNFLRYYCEGYDHTFNPDNFEFWTNDFKVLFPFKTDNAYYKFIYDDYAFELFGKCETCGRKLTTDLSVWMEEIQNIETDEPIEVIFVSPNEYGQSVGYSYFFISKLGPKVREVYFPIVELDVWNKCDVLITANPTLINNKPEGKKCVKINTEYNEESDADFSYRDFSKFLTDINNTKKLFD